MRIGEVCLLTGNVPRLAASRIWAAAEPAGENSAMAVPPSQSVFFNDLAKNLKPAQSPNTGCLDMLKMPFPKEDPIILRYPLYEVVSSTFNDIIPFRPVHCKALPEEEKEPEKSELKLQNT